MHLHFYTRPNCPLCDRLEDLLEPHLAALAQRRDEAVELVSRNILDDPAWHAAYRDRIPVVTLDERVLLEGRPTETEIEQALGNL